MSQSLLLTLYGSSALIAAIVFIAALRIEGFSRFRVGVLIYLTGTAWWALVDLWRWISGSGAIELVEALTLPAGAFVIAGVRVSVHAISHPGWRVTWLDGLGMGLHPFATVLVAAVPQWRQFIAQANDQGVVEYGPLFWCHVAITYSLLVAATFDLLRGGAGSRALTRRTAPFVVAIWAVPLVASVVTMVSEGPNGVDLMPPGFALTALLVWRTLAPGDAPTYVPVARSQVFEELADAVIVVSDDDIILDANLAALALVGAEGTTADFKGRSLRSAWPALADAAMHAGEHDLELDTGTRVVDVTVSTLSEASRAPSVRAVVMRDVTEAVTQRRELAGLRAELADMVMRDAVTGLHNRRYAEQNIPDNLSRCAARGVPFSLALIDVDFFKDVNDTHGHPVGDRMLKALAAAMLDEVPASMLARFGGEEFLVMMPGLTLEQAFERTERLRAACAQAEVITREGSIRVTVSAGLTAVAPAEGTAAQAVEQADAALYRAKLQGRNQTCMSAPMSALSDSSM